MLLNLCLQNGDLMSLATPEYYESLTTIQDKVKVALFRATIGEQHTALFACLTVTVMPEQIIFQQDHGTDKRCVILDGAEKD